MTDLKKLNLGCGEFHKEGYVNVDFFAIKEPDLRHNLEILPYPFASDSFDLIELDHVLEHLSNPFEIMRELHRISKAGGLIKIKVPHFSRGFTHPEHKRGFDVSFPLYFDKSFKGGFQGFELKLSYCKLAWFAQPYLKKDFLSPISFRIAQTLGKTIDFFASINPFIFSRIFCFWVGGFEEIEFEFIVIK